MTSFTIGLSVGFTLAIVMRKMYDEAQKKDFNKVN